MIHLWLAGGIIIAVLSAGGWAVHTLRAADRAEINALHEVAEHNRTVMEREKRQAAVSARLAAEAADANTEARSRLRERLRGLERANREEPATGECPADCRLRWQADDSIQG